MTVVGWHGATVRPGIPDDQTEFIGNMMELILL